MGVDDAFVPWGEVVVIGATGEEVATWRLLGAGRPDLGTVELLAGWLLAARRAGGTIDLRHPAAELAELLGLAGLGLGDLHREVGGQPEGGEEWLGVEERVVFRHPSR